YVGMIHDANVSPKDTAGPHWQPFPPEEIERLLGEDWIVYHPPQSRSEPTAVREEPSPPTMLTIARESDLSLPEFAAFNFGRVIPWMRRWEQPFVLFQSRLADTMAVLDCSINPANFGERLAALYPHVTYRQHSPI